MVKGRRVRAVVACARNDDCCSPNPKRRGQKITLDRAVLQPNKSNTITAFFQSANVEVDEKLPVSGNALKGARKKTGNGIVLTLLRDGVTDATSLNNNEDVAKTPVKINDTTSTVTAMTACNEGQPTTPHRIELCLDDDNNKKDDGKVPPVQKAGTKAKKRLMNNCQLMINHQMTNGQTKDNHKVTEYFPVRRSVRKTKRTVLEEKQKTLEHMLRNETEEGLEVKFFEDKGRGVVAAKPFTKGDFVVEYSGDLIDINEARKRELKYAQDLNTGCYMYYFKHNNQHYCVDATAESGKLGRLVNHSRNGNLITRTVSVDNKPRLVLIAKDDIKEGDEITYDYGDRSKESLKHHPWLAY